MCCSTCQNKVLSANKFTERCAYKTSLLFRTFDPLNTKKLTVPLCTAAMSHHLNICMYVKTEASKYSQLACMKYVTMVLFMLMG
jgi:hypothetical protein